MKNLFFIRDCNDRIVGNQKGYPTFKGANAQVKIPGSPAYRAIWAAYDQRMTNYHFNCTGPDQRRRNISSIRLNEEA